MNKAVNGIPNNWDRSGLPGWTYFSDELHALERREIFQKHWQLVCHVSDIPEPGDYMTLDIVDERALVIRGHDQQVRGFHNLCRHRGSRVVPDERGRCNKALICPFHGWAYNLDGSLRGIAERASFPKIDPQKWGLKPLDTEIWQGFVFVRFVTSDQPAVADIMGRFDAEVAPYEMSSMIPANKTFWHAEVNVNWKALRDVDNEGYHVRAAHPGLHDLYGNSYHDEPFTDGTSRSVGTFNQTPGKLWSVRNYLKILPKADHLPESHQRCWLYMGMFPNVVIAVYPDSMIFYQEVPVAAGKTRQRGAAYRYADESRETRAARYLSGRIDYETGIEDQLLSQWVDEATRSSGYDQVLLSDLEYGLKTYHDHLRALIPVMQCQQEPPAGELEQLNNSLSDQ